MNWLLVPIGALSAILLLFVLLLFCRDPTLYELFLIAPCIALLIITLLLLLTIPRTRRGSAKLLLATTAFIVTGIGITGSRVDVTLRPTLRWAFFSRKFKSEALMQKDQPSGTFKHVEWDGWGGTPVGDWTAYVVFDPTDSLKSMADRLHPGVVKGIPCDVLSIQRMEPDWYSITLEMNEWWDQCGK